MASTTPAAFREFKTFVVNLDPEVSKKARKSRSWLVDQIRTIKSDTDVLPDLYTDKDIFYGSFARNTKIRELDDVDLLICLKALGTTYSYDAGRIILRVPDGITLSELCHDNSNLLNSRKVINRFVKRLKGVDNYKKADVHRDGCAAVLDLTSHSWSFDIVPSFFTTPDSFGRTYYVIPDGDGHWMKTDPRIDQERTTSINQAHDGKVLDLIRIAKYWNARSTAPAMRSYLFECLILEYCSAKTTKVGDSLGSELALALQSISRSVRSSVSDPTGIANDINDLTESQREAISARAATDAEKGVAAVIAEMSGDHEESIRLWTEVLGPEFPSYSAIGSLSRSASKV